MMKKRSCWRALPFAVLIGVGGIDAADASPLFELAGAVQGPGGLNARALESGAASAYFNPAFLPDAEEGLQLGLFGLADQIGVQLRGRPTQDADVPAASVDMEMPGGGRYPRYGVPTAWLENGRPAEPPDAPLRARPRQSAGTGHNRRVYQVAGLVKKFWGNRLGAGIYAMVPYGKFTGAAAFYSDEREQYFSNSLHPELYSDRLTATALAFGLGARLSSMWSLGAAATLSLRTVATTPTYVTDVGNFQSIVVDSKVDVSMALAPHVSAVFTPVRGTRFSATVHTPQKLEIVTDFSFLLSNGLEQSAALQFTHAYLPWMFGGGVSHDFSPGQSSGFQLVASGMYARWSQYIDRHGQTPTGAYRWYDTLSGALGVRYRDGAGRAFIDAGYQPSPVPNQTGRTNYVDSARASLSTGLDLGFKVWGGSLRLGLQLQVHRVLPRTTTKTVLSGADGVVDEVPDDAVVGGQPLAGRAGLQTNNAGWPGFQSAGWILGESLHATFIF
jgi:long-chain fatty acid transport protein